VSTLLEQGCRLGADEHSALKGERLGRRERIITVADQSPRHIVAVSAVVINATGEVLLVQTPRRGWEPPGGQVERGEDPLTALAREVAEESGCAMVPGRLVGVYSVYSEISDSTIIELTFLCRHTSGVPTGGMECLAAGWYPIGQALHLVTHPFQAAKLGDALAARAASDPPGVVYRAYRRESPPASGAGPAGADEAPTRQGTDQFRYVLLHEDRC